jgi:hypothetical protein
MKRGRFWVRAILGLLAIGLLIGASTGAFRMGWWQGYRAAQVTDGSEGQGDVPGWPMMVPGGWMHHRLLGGWVTPFFGGALLHIGLLLGVLFLVAGLIRSCAWRAAGHMPHHDWHHPPFGHHPPHRQPPSQGHGFEGKYSPDGQATSETGNRDQE